MIAVLPSKFLYGYFVEGRRLCGRPRLRHVPVASKRFFISPRVTGNKRGKTVSNG